MLDIKTLYQMLALAAILFWWWQSIKRKEFAEGYAKRYCDSMDLQWLDQNLVLRKRRWIKTGRITGYIERYYEFEFATSGKYRHLGFVIMQGRHLRQILTDPYESAETSDSDDNITH